MALVMIISPTLDASVPFLSWGLTNILCLWTSFQGISFISYFIYLAFQSLYNLNVGLDWLNLPNILTSTWRENDKPLQYLLNSYSATCMNGTVYIVLHCYCIFMAWFDFKSISLLNWYSILFSAHISILFWQLKALFYYLGQNWWLHLKVIQMSSSSSKIIT